MKQTDSTMKLFALDTYLLYFLVTGDNMVVNYYSVSDILRVDLYS